MTDELLEARVRALERARLDTTDRLRDHSSRLVRLEEWVRGRRNIERLEADER